MKSMSTARSQQILALLAVAQLMGVLDFSIVNVALPSIQRTFHLAPADLQWLVSAYALTLGGFLLLGGRASDLFDRKMKGCYPCRAKADNTHPKAREIYTALA